MMNPVFAASRFMGHSLIYADYGKEKEARKALSDAGRDFGRAGLADAQRVVRNLGANWAHHAGKIMEGFHQEIQADLEKKDRKSYHAASAGWCLGLASHGSSLVTKHKDFAATKRLISEWLTHARNHTDALRMEKLVPGMKDFKAQFNTCLNGISVIKDPKTWWQDFRNCSSLIVNLADQVGNAIR
jgi:hypothetical protein